MQIFGDSISGNCLKVKWTADLLAIPYEWVEIDIMAGGSRTPDFVAMNPAGQVPAIRLPDGRALAQSNAIMLYLAEGSALIPADRFDRAKMLEWLFWEQYSHEPAVAVARFQVRYLGKGAANLDPKLVEKSKAALDRLQAGIGEGPFILGDALSLADIALVAYTRMAGDGGFDLALYPGLQRWIARVEDALHLSPYA
ncbi:glutathione S-transferase family protein [Sphingomonas sp. MMS24-J13]|uniref:glutathione S-transferase family protein n=1 Tax=Sphingomonas sp. MMS24-J13 TaxID=3238686 RepID=UPI00384B3C39